MELVGAGGRAGADESVSDLLKPLGGSRGIDPVTLSTWRTQDINVVFICCGFLGV